MAVRQVKRVRVDKRQIDREVAILLRRDRKLVSLITTTFLREVVTALTALKDVQLLPLGSLRVVPMKGKATNLRRGTYKPGESYPIRVEIAKKYFVYFTKSRELKDAIRRFHGDPGRVVEDTMEKFGVSEEEEKNEKRAAKGCPHCGEKPERHGNILICPNCGTEPFEKEEK